MDNQVQMVFRAYQVRAREKHNLIIVIIDIFQVTVALRECQVR